MKKAEVFWVIAGIGVVLLWCYGLWSATQHALNKPPPPCSPTTCAPSVLADCSCREGQILTPLGDGTVLCACPADDDDDG